MGVMRDVRRECVQAYVNSTKSRDMSDTKTLPVVDGTCPDPACDFKLGKPWILLVARAMVESRLQQLGLNQQRAPGSEHSTR
jgi:hypothetical protein